MKTEYTDEPWVLMESQPCSSGGSVYAGSIKIGTVVGGCGRRKTKRGRANARLIIASPELLKALKAIVKGWESINPDARVPDQINVDEFWINAKAAIAKAEGE